MKRDMDLIRALLMSVESDEHGYSEKMKIEGYTQEKIDYHIFLLGEAGFAIVNDTGDFGSKSPEAKLVRLTWAGHEFLDSVRENNVWNQAKNKIGKIGGATIPIWTAVLTEIIKKQLGL